MVPELSAEAAYLRQPPDGSIFVMGAVGTPGRYAFGPDLTLLDLLAIVKGPSADADLGNISVIHRGAAGPEVAKLDLWLFFETGDRSLLPQLQPGDIVYVPNLNRNWLEQPVESTVRMLGAIAKPGRYRFDDQMTILDLLAEAGGPIADAYQQRIVVVNLSCCRDQARVFDLERFAQNRRLQPVACCPSRRYSIRPISFPEQLCDVHVGRPRCVPNPFDSVDCDLAGSYVTMLPVQRPELEAIYWQTVGRKIRTICVTAAAPGEGVSELGLALARRGKSAGLKALLIDANLPRPTISLRLGLSSACWSPVGGSARKAIACAGRIGA